MTGWIVVALSLSLAAGALAFFGLIRLRGGYNAIDHERLAAASHMFDQAQASAHHLLESQAAVIANDGRIRATLATPDIDAATLRDLLDDVRASSGAGLLAILAPEGVVRAASGDQALEGMDLSSAQVVARLLNGDDAAGGTWTYGKSAMNVGAARVRLGPLLAGVLLIGHTIPAETFTTIESAVAVHGALVIGQDVAVRSQHAPDAERVRAVLGGASDSTYAHATRDLSVGSAARILWLVPTHLAAPSFFGVAIALFALMGLTGVASIALLWYAWKW